MGTLVSAWHQSFRRGHGRFVNRAHCATRKQRYQYDNGEVFKHIAQSSLNLFISNSRHLRLSCVFLAQKLSQLSTIIRANTDCFVCFSACSFVELSALWKEVSVVERKRFLQIFKETTKEPYCFLVISVIAGKIRFYKNAREELSLEMTE